MSSLGIGVCPQCLARNREDARFCHGCGARRSGVCPSCGSQTQYGRFCDGCGASLASNLTSVANLSRFTSPGSYTPSHLAQQILTSRSALEGERKQVTVLFADTKSSMELIADRDPEEARQLLDAVLAHMMEAVHRYEGTVNQVMGDGIMALFGAPVAHEDHAVRACYAALQMNHSVKRYAEELHRRLGVPIHIRVGLNSGEVVVRSIGNDLRMDYSAVGQTTHLAARMEQMAMPGSVLISVETLKLAEGYITVSPLGPRPVRGIEAPIEVYELTGAAPMRSRFRVGAARGLSRFVGRSDEIEQILRTLERAGMGNGQILAVAGEPGVGKSRLFFEFTRSHRPHDWLVLEGTSVSYGKATSFLPVIDLLKSYFHIEDRDSAQRIREKVAGKIVTLDERLRDTIPAILSLLEALPEDDAFRALDPPQRRGSVLDALKQLLVRESQRQPLILIFENLHWIDSESQAALDVIVASLPMCRILLLTNYRPEYEDHWATKSYYTRLRLDPLPMSTMDELLGVVLGSSPNLAETKTILKARAAGNPFFLEECVRALVETHALTGESGAYRPVQGTEALLQIPVTVQALLAARIDRLSAESKRLLQSAAVIGINVPLALLRVISESPDDELERCLSDLQSAEFLYQTNLFPETEYTFKHALTHEVAYGGVLHERRRTLHATIMGAMESLYTERLPEHVERLAYHAFQGEAWGKAVVYYRQAGEKVAARSAYREAVASFEQALAALAHLPERRETLEQGIDLRFALRSALFPLGEVRRDLDHIRAAETLAERLGDQRRLGWLFSYAARDHSLLGDQDSAVVSGRRALAAAVDAKDSELQIVTGAYLGCSYHALGDYRSAVNTLRQSVTSLQDGPVDQRFGLPGPASVFFRIWLVWALAKLGAFEEGASHADEAVRIAELTDQPLVVTVARYSQGFLWLHQGDLPRAIPVLERSLELCRTWHLEAWSPNILSSLGYALVLSGRTDEGVALLEEAVEQTESLGVLVNHAAEVAWLSEAYLLAGRVDRAARLAERALDLARHHKEKGNLAFALRLAAEVTRLGGSMERHHVGSDYDEALMLARELGMRPLEAQCHLGLGWVLRDREELDMAGPHFQEARRMFKEMNMPLWLRREAELGSLG
jgi:class 3 adenylate cyclase/tetratricopeptide (TPR) repeat protein